MSFSGASNQPIPPSNSGGHKGRDRDYTGIVEVAEPSKTTPLDSAPKAIPPADLENKVLTYFSAN